MKKKTSADAAPEAVTAVTPEKPAKEKKPRTKRILTLERKHTLEVIIFLAPWIIGTAAFFLNPIISSMRLSFSEITQLKGFKMGWVGLKNFEYILAYDINFMPIFVTVVKDTLINTPLTLVFSLIIALLINKPFVGRGFFRTCFFIPVLLGSGYVMQQLLQIDAMGTVGVGIVLPPMLKGLLGNTISVVVQSFLDRITLILWHSGVQIILFLAGLQSINGTLYEAAKVDGATQWEMFWKITLPMISPIILLNFVYTMVMYFTSSDNELVAYIIDEVFVSQQFGQGAAMGWVYFLFVFALCGLVFGIIKLNSREKKGVTANGKRR